MIIYIKHIIWALMDLLDKWRGNDPYDDDDDTYQTQF